MDIHKIAFILCVNDEYEFNESLDYIEELTVPEGYQTDVIAVREAPSMAAGYNAAMKESDAKYKIYLHQDVFLIYKDLLKELIAIFDSDETIGMIGTLGCRVLPENAHAISRWDTGRNLCNGFSNYIHGYQDETSHGGVDVMAIDGMFMATQYDIAWREDLFDGWDFYDISESCEFIRAGKRVVIPYQKEYWVFHDNENSNLGLFDTYRLKFIGEYQDIYPFRAEEKNGFEQRGEYERVKAEAKKELETLIDAGKMDEVCGFLLQPENQGHLILKELEVICRIYSSEKETASPIVIYEEYMSYREVYARFQHLRHLIKRVEFQHGDLGKICTELMRDYSVCAVVTVILVYGMWRRELYDKLLSVYKKYDRKQYQEFLRYQTLFADNGIHGESGMSETEKKCFVMMKIREGGMDSEAEKRLMQYDKVDYTVFTELPVGEEYSISLKNAHHLCGNIVNLVPEQQDKLYSDYSEVLIYGNEMEEYVKLYQDTDIPVTWYTEDGYTGSISYSDNIQVQPVFA